MAGAPRILQAEQIDHGVMITFEGGRAALFSSAFLYAHIADAEEVADEYAQSSDHDPTKP